MPKNEKNGKAGTKTRKVKTIKKIAVAAMLMALSVVIGVVCKTFFTYGIYYRITFENLPVILAACLFGPWYGAAVGVGADLVSCVCSPNPNVNPIISLGALSVGLCAGIVVRYVVKKKSKLQTAVAVALAHLVGQVAIKSVGKMVYYYMPWEGIFIGLAVSVVVGVVEFWVIECIRNNKQIMAFTEEC